MTVESAPQAATRSASGSEVDATPAAALGSAAFVDRHIGPDTDQTAVMLKTLGLSTTEELVERAIPGGIRLQGDLRLPPALTETEALAWLRDLAARNKPRRAMIGLGYHGTVTPPVIRRNVLEDPAWYTAYTPYQPEISQGRLEALINFQTMIEDLTALPIAGASLLDEATAVAEAAALARRNTKHGSVLVMDADILPQTVAVTRTRAEGLGIEVVVADGPLLDAIADHDLFGVVVQTPGTSGALLGTAALREIADATHAKGGLVIAACDLMALTLTTPPGEWGADVAVGSSQRFGVPLFYGGPHAGFMSVRSGLERSLPGRLVGASVDSQGAPAFRLALQTREQHIRREKATSNICTAQVLLAVVAAMYATYHGPYGLRAIARRIHGDATALAADLRSLDGVEVDHQSFFDTVQVTAPGRGRTIVAAARERGVHLRLIDDDHVGIAVGEDTTGDDLRAVRAAFGGGELSGEHWGDLAGSERSSDFLTHPVFTSHHNETSMLRYLRALSDRDYALDRGMIPLGSCTMKLNATAEMEPISYDGFANLHPFAPDDDAQGYLELISTLESWLAEATGYAKVSVQPNAGSQGEFAGLLAIHAYHRSRGDDQRRVMLIPSSAHGTNAASAAMAGLKVLVVKANPDGSISRDDLAAKIDANRDQLAGIMITYPSTHGAYEDGISQICADVHDAGGQVYIDGANFNALLGLAQYGRFGGDVSHLNLHKTFCIPHGGGGPGVGPIGVAEHLVPFIPKSVSAAPYGSAGILAISAAYIAMMGAEGLTRATVQAVLSANYIAARLGEHYPVLYTGHGGLVAHECILDLRPLTRQTGVTVDDVAKRLIDYGFHAPTMSFPVAGTLMVEPTESEDLDEVDRFIDAMIAIRQEADRVGAGEWPADDNPLHNAPHTAAVVMADEWTHPYSRTAAAYPFGVHRGPIASGAQDKYWPPVGRIDGVYGDRNLVCSCPPPEAFED
ncbi:glycine dehydrogenase (decarboxylating) [Microlunatus endophyticus]|uniref:Glycine dehydrogenase (decarboxylating) n=1 Tax=Microlunatus endophyticus TaxID=1716077 RepID=A0A917S3Q6_9ACTN|nr:aminomethyl-transferring glycine dehydrogenase [Microlunatus endophyticus]GGL52605.1 glycine dehydrogenase (decarboxylating) [Microlunatus endophyticus]